MGSVFPYIKGEKRQFNIDADWGRTWTLGNKSAFTKKQISVLDHLHESRVPSSEAAAVYTSALTACDVTENQVIATAHHSLQPHFNGRKLYLLLHSI